MPFLENVLKANNNIDNIIRNKGVNWETVCALDNVEYDQISVLFFRHNMIPKLILQT